MALCRGVLRKEERSYTSHGLQLCNSLASAFFDVVQCEGFRSRKGSEHSQITQTMELDEIPVVDLTDEPQFGLHSERLGRQRKRGREDAATEVTLHDETDNVTSRRDEPVPKVIQCHNCLKFGHTAKFCLEKTASKDRCYKCNQEGHRARECKVKGSLDRFGPRRNEIRRIYDIEAQKAEALLRIRGKVTDDALDQQLEKYNQVHAKGEEEK